MQLDQYDCRLIQLFKSNKPYTENDIKQIWAERCAYNAEHVTLRSISIHLIALAQKLNLFTSPLDLANFINDLHPNQNYFYVINQSLLKKDTIDFDIILLSRLNNLFRSTKTSKLPGYKEFVENPNIKWDYRTIMAYQKI